MSFIKRLGYYLIGLSVGLIFLFFFFNGKRTQCNYTPDARVKNDILQKKWIFETEFYTIHDTIKWFDDADVRFSESNVGLDSCNVYKLRYKKDIFYVENCKEAAFFRR